MIHLSHLLHVLYTYLCEQIPCTFCPLYFCYGSVHLLISIWYDFFFVDLSDNQDSCDYNWFTIKVKNYFHLGTSLYRVLFRPRESYKLKMSIIWIVKETMNIIFNSHLLQHKNHWMKSSTLHLYYLNSALSIPCTLSTRVRMPDLNTYTIYFTT